jgi:hypothetical protein
MFGEKSERAPSQLRRRNGPTVRPNVDLFYINLGKVFGKVRHDQTV